MQSYPIPHNENERLAALASYHILDTPPEQEYEELALLAAEICQTPISLIGMIDDKRHWFKSAIGTEMVENTKERAFCVHTILKPEEVLVVEDMRKDVRFASNPLVTGDPNILFYAGVPLVNDEGFALGTLCVMDLMPKELTAHQVSALKILAKQVITRMELQKKLAELETANEVLLEANTFIQKFASTTAHDIKNPLSSILLTSQLLQMRLRKDGDERNMNLVDINISSTKKLLSLVDEMLEYSKTPSILLSNQHSVDLCELLNRVINMLDIPEGVKIILPPNSRSIVCTTVAVEQIFLNLLTNAIRYNDKAETNIRILFREEDDCYSFKVADNGIGIAEENLKKIFNEHIVLNTADRFDKKGNGLGLNTVKTLVEKLQGKIEVESVIGKGSTFIFSLKKFHMPLS